MDRRFVPMHSFFFRTENETDWNGNLQDRLRVLLEVLAITILHETRTSGNMIGKTETLKKFRKTTHI